MDSNILAVGSVAYDSIQTPFGKIKKTLGGSAAYFSLAASLFAPASIIAVVGDDFKDFNVFKKRKIDTSGLQKAKGRTFAWQGRYGFDLNTRRTLSLKLNVFKSFKPRLSENQKKAEFIFLANIQPKLQLMVLNQIKRPKLVGLDTATEWISRTKPSLLRVLKRVDILVINEGEARELTKEHNLLKAARKILAIMREPYSLSQPRQNVRWRPILIIKQGEHGLLLFQNNFPPQSVGKGKGRGLKIFNLPGYPLENVVDPTGAGDSFAGALMGFLAQKGDLSLSNLKKACAVASTVASFCVEDFGTKRLQTLKQKEIQGRLKIYKRLIYF